MVYSNYDFVGIKRIQIPKKDSDFIDSATTLSILAKYMPSILSKHKANAEKIKYLWSYYNGVQDIKSKVRPYIKDALNNNKLTENHARREVDFKVSLFKNRTYTLKKSVGENDKTKKEMDIFLNYLSDCQNDGKSKDLATKMFACGVGCAESVPKTDIIDSDYRVIDSYDIENVAPFEFNAIDPTNNFVVYSSDKNHTPLFCVSIIEVEKDSASKNITLQKEIRIETRYASYVCNTNLSYGGLKNMYLETEKAFYYLPMSEFSLNEDRIGIIEINRDIFNMINILASSIVDITQDNMNAILVFKNTDITEKEVQQMRSAGAIILPSSKDARSNAEADLDVLKVEMPIKELNAYIDNLVSTADDIVGVASPSNTVTSGGSTGQAIVYGGGWQNAYDIAEREKSKFVDFDKNMLALMLFHCKIYPFNVIESLKASQINVKYTITRSDNIQVKAQAILNMYTANMPLKRILQAVGVFDNEDEVSNEWETRDNELRNLSKGVVNETN